MKSTITSKFQITIPKPIREHLGLDIQDTLEWKLENGKVIIIPAKNTFLKYKNSIQIGRGDIEKDIHEAWNNRLEKYM